MMRRFCCLAICLVGCSSTTAGKLGPEKPDCQAQCEADALEKARQYCGSDGQTYSGCQWACAQMPGGVKVFPGACQANGMPAPGAPSTPADGKEICDWAQIG